MRELISSIRNLPRHFITALQSIWRNGVMSFSSIFAVMVTLLLIAVVGSIALNIQNITSNIEDGVRIYVKLDRTIDAQAEQAVGEQIKTIPNVKEIKFYSKDEEISKLIKGYGEEGAELFESYRGEGNPLGAAYDVEITDTKYIEQVQKEIRNIPEVKEAQYGGESTNNMIETLQMIRTGGMIFVIGLVVVALFMIANTIKITITSRQTEISIMRMVGASNWYIRIPFMLEGMLIGVLGAIVPILVLVYGYGFLYDVTGGMIVSSMLTLSKPYPFIKDFALILIGLGSGVGFIGSYVSVRRFLKF